MLGAHEHDRQFAGILRQLKSSRIDFMKKAPLIRRGLFCLMVT